MKDFCKNVENGNRVVGLSQIKKSCIKEFTFKFSSLTNFSNRNVETDTFFMITFFFFFFFFFLDLENNFYLIYNNNKITYLNEK